jgi:hypothetical protein
MSFPAFPICVSGLKQSGATTRSSSSALICDDITASKFAINRQVEHGKVASATFDLEFRPD